MRVCGPPKLSFTQQICSVSMVFNVMRAVLGGGVPREALRVC